MVDCTVRENFFLSKIVWKARAYVKRDLKNRSINFLLDIHAFTFFIIFFAVSFNTIQQQKKAIMKFQATILALAFAANVKADDICKAKCGTENGERVCRFKVNRDIFAGELGYYTMEGEEDCGVNPTLGK